jgi:type I restriction enzyme R subunit
MRKTSTQIRALHPNLVLEFVQHTQPVQWKVITDYYGPRVAPAFLDELTKALDSQGTLNVLRHGLDFFGQTFRLAYFAPATALNPETAMLYAANRLTITRQVRFTVRRSPA